MRIRAPRLGIAPRVALVGGGALVVANLLLLVRPVGAASTASLVSAVLVFVAYLVLALGLPGHRGVLGSERVARVVRVALVSSGALGLAVAIASRFGYVDPDVGPTLGYRIYSSALLVGEMASLFLLLAAAALAIRSPKTPRDAKYGLRMLALVSLAGFAIDNVLGALAVTVISPSGLDTWFEVTTWLTRFELLAGLAVGLWFAWPWLGPRVARLRVVVARAYRRYVDSTP